MAVRLTKIMDDTWSTYESLFNLMSTEDVAKNNQAIEAISELELELESILSTIKLHLKMLKSVKEPLPTDVVDDFEKSVLSTLANLDQVDLDNYRVYDSDEDEDEQY